MPSKRYNTEEIIHKLREANIGESPKPRFAVSHYDFSIEPLRLTLKLDQFLRAGQSQGW